jgi:FLVCR family MFS transporter
MVSPKAADQPPNGSGSGIGSSGSKYVGNGGADRKGEESAAANGRRSPLPTAVNEATSPTAESPAASSASASWSRKKWIALFLFCWFSMNNGFAWILFDPVATELPEAFPYLTPKSVELLSSWQPLIYIVAFYPLTKLQNSRDGLRRSVLLGAAAEVAGSGLKVAASFVPATEGAIILLHAGQILSAIASPVAIGAPPALSALWFSNSNQGTRATAAAVLANNLGNALGYGIVPLLTDAFGFESVLRTEFVSACLLALVAVYMFPSPPGTRRRRLDHQQLSGEETDQMEMSPDLATVDMEFGTGEPVSLWSHVKSLLSLKSGVALCLCYAWSSGSYVAWTSLYEELIGGGEDLTPLFVGVTSLVSMVGYIIGGILSSSLTDLYFHQKMRNVLAVSTAGAALFGAGMIATVSTAKTGCYHDIRDGLYRCPNATEGIKVGIVVLGALTGAGTGAAAPIFYELLAEVSYPIPESVSGNVLSLGENIGALIMYQVVARFLTLPIINMTFVVGLCICVALLLGLVREVHLRPGQSQRQNLELTEVPDDTDDVSSTDLNNEPLETDVPIPTRFSNTSIVSL